MFADEVIFYSVLSLPSLFCFPKPHRLRPRSRVMYRCKLRIIDKHGKLLTPFTVSFSPWIMTLSLITFSSDSKSTHRIPGAWRKKETSFYCGEKHKTVLSCQYPMTSCFAKPFFFSWITGCLKNETRRGRLLFASLPVSADNFLFIYFFNQWPERRKPVSHSHIKLHSSLNYVQFIQPLCFFGSQWRHSFAAHGIPAGQWKARVTVFHSFLSAER